MERETAIDEKLARKSKVENENENERYFGGKR